MKYRLAGPAFAAAVAVVLTGAALAQNVPPQFVVTGKAAEQIQDFSTINLATAQHIYRALFGERPIDTLRRAGRSDRPL